ncbi:YjhX family toxin [Vibrio taketomensis]|uniref:YjhX family toxin n=1 Tax=Vibrio taketomensis TaxID=2572923 RepID=UPI001389497F|nr:YjhX family toxin [Vibrio taketomensis]
MNISKHEQRVLHVLALGGEIQYVRSDNSKISQIFCYSREGHILTDCSMEVFKRLKSKKLISSKKSAPYRITTLGATSVRSQMFQR